MQEEKQSGQFAALIGLDWADRKHDVCLQVPGSDKLERSIVEHRPVALEAWLDGLGERFGGAPVAVAVRSKASSATTTCAAKTASSAASTS